MNFTCFIDVKSLHAFIKTDCKDSTGLEELTEQIEKALSDMPGGTCGTAVMGNVRS